MSDFYAPNLIYIAPAPDPTGSIQRSNPLTVFEGLTSKERGEEVLEGVEVMHYMQYLQPTPISSGPAHKTAKMILFALSAT